MSAKKIDCLIIDDDPEICNILKIYCQRLASFRNIIIANCGQSASQSLRNQSFGLILLDINIPKKSALDVLADLKTERLNSVNDIVIVSGEIDVQKIVSFSSSGVKRFITKPFFEAQFKEKVLPIIEKNLSNKKLK